MARLKVIPSKVFFCVERMRKQHGISFHQPFSDFHCLITRSALEWYWQVLEDHADDLQFVYFKLKSELLGHFKTAESDYEVIREILERKQSRNPLRSFTAMNLTLLPV